MPGSHCLENTLTMTHDTKRPSALKVDVTHTEERDGARWEYRSNGDIAMYLPMLTCTRSLTASYGGKSVTLTAGVSKVCRGHDLARAYPHHFTGAVAAPVRSRSTGRSAAVDPRVEAELRMRSDLLSQLRAQTIAGDTPRTGPSQYFLRDEEPS